MQELKSTDAEELDLLTEYLGPQSSRQATTLRSAYGTSPGKAVKAIWERLDERYGASELVAEALLLKIRNSTTIC
ncbi:hypothetical protein DPMN_074890 [Dreissena polymorpha]|uniref:Uncharacterized protein n=1 Tax=Dreissena polymorpha TaxID=45954 RepID=A0A9D3YKN5_DREPO|nr:hypothetical protein DPMN_074890 [Dreissena polymorpha]